VCRDRRGSGPSTVTGRLDARGRRLRTALAAGLATSMVEPRVGARGCRRSCRICIRGPVDCRHQRRCFTRIYVAKQEKRGASIEGESKSHPSMNCAVGDSGPRSVTLRSLESPRAAMKGVRQPVKRNCSPPRRPLSYLDPEAALAGVMGGRTSAIVQANPTNDLVEKKGFTP
jgi:hypothetical protein